MSVKLLNFGNPITIDNETVKNIRFSQVTVAPTLSTGQSLDELVRDILENGWDLNCPLQVVVMPDGGFTSFDNRRLYALKTIIENNPKIEVKANIILSQSTTRADGETIGRARDYINKMDPNDRDSIVRELVTCQQKHAILGNTLGGCIESRMHGIEPSKRKLLGITPEFLDANPYGFTKMPTVWTEVLKQKSTNSIAPLQPSLLDYLVVKKPKNKKVLKAQ